MSIYRNYRSIYKKYYGSIPTDEMGRTYEIHHIDGNRNNNDISNLVALTIEDHYDLHMKQGDYAACLRMTDRMKVSIEEKSKLALMHVQSQLRNGTHPWKSEKYKRQQKERALSDKNPFRGGEIQRKSNIKRIKNGTHHLLGSSVNEKMLKDGRHTSQKIWTCEHCNKTGKNTTNYIRFHGNNCKLK